VLVDGELLDVRRALQLDTRGLDRALDAGLERVEVLA